MVYDGALTAGQIEDRFSKVTVGAPEIPIPRLPVVEKNPGRFGAYYTKLKYYPGWDNLWPVDNDSEVVVCFDKSPVKLIFWRGTRYGPAWVSENENWMADQSVETWNTGKDDTEGCFEHMPDRHCRFSHVRIIENTAARAVVHWRYALVSRTITSGGRTRRQDGKLGRMSIINNQPGSGPVEINLRGSKHSPVINPAIRVKNWNSDTAKVMVNGKPSDDVRLGFNHGIEGTGLVLFLFRNETAPVKITIAK